MRAVLIDLDDTLYLEHDYVRSGYDAVAAHLADRTGLEPQIVADRLWYEFRREGRSGAFDRALRHLQVDAVPVGDLVEIYRSHAPDIALLPGVEPLLASLRRDAATALVTDGSEGMQRRKVEALGLASKLDHVVYAWALGRPKPDPHAFQVAAELCGASPREAVVVGDDPYHDAAAATAAGMAMVRIRQGRVADVPTHAPPERYAEVRRLGDVTAAIATLLG